MANNVFFRADLYTITLLDGTVYRWTSCESSLLVGGQTYLANGIVLGRSRVRQSARLQVDTLEIDLAGAIQLSGSAVGLLAINGHFDDARVRLDHLIMPSPGDVSWGPIPSWFEGRVSGVDPGSGRVKLSVASEHEALDRMLPRFLYSLSCTHGVYDRNCGIDREDFKAGGTVAASPAPTASTFATNLYASDDDFYNLGVIWFNSGALSGIRRSVRSYVQNEGVFTLSMPFPAAPAAGDTFWVYPGCSKLATTCDTVFSNLIHFRGFPSMPVPEGNE